MKLTNILVRLAIIAAVTATAACERGDGDAERPRAGRSRGAPLGQLAKDNVSKVTYPIAPGAAGAPLEPGSWQAGRLEESDPLLDDRTHYDAWTLSGDRGARYVITMESEDFDAFLMIAGPLEGEISILAEDDDGAGGTDARVEFVVPRNGSYAVIANSVFPAERGSYRIRIDAAETTVALPDGRRTAELTLTSPVSSSRAGES